MPLWTAIATMAVTLVSGCAAAPPSSKPLAAPPGYLAAHRATAVGVLDQGWHTGLVLPARAMAPALEQLRRWFPAAQYLVFGWGNRTFYMTPHPGSGTALAALFPSPSVVFVYSLPKDLPTALPQSKLRWLCLSRGGARRLAIYLAHYLKKRPGDKLVDLGRGPFPDSRFFAATGRYDVFHTCNTWTVAALAFAGLPVSASGIVFAGQAMSEIRSLPPCPSRQQGRLKPPLEQ